MEDIGKDFCFCGLALGKRYRDFAHNLAGDFARHHPGIKYVLLTDRPKDFRDFSNVIAIRHKQQSIMFPYHDRRYAIKEALRRFDTAISIDTDIRILRAIPFPEHLGLYKGIICRSENLFDHLRKYQPENMKHYETISRKLRLPFDKVPHIGEFIFSITKDSGKENDFIRYWGIIARYLELHGVCGADGPAIGLAAEKAGYAIRNDDWASKVEHMHVQHIKGQSGQRVALSFRDALFFRLGYHYRLNKAWILALRNFNFYYR